MNCDYHTMILKFYDKLYLQSGKSDAILLAFISEWLFLHSSFSHVLHQQGYNQLNKKANVCFFKHNKFRKFFRLSVSFLTFQMVFGLSHFCCHFDFGQVKNRNDFLLTFFEMEKSLFNQQKVFYVN